jgi:serine/threonine-protein kinase
MNPAAEVAPEPAQARQESAGSRRTENVVADELVMGRFRVIERIGSGGMGTVYRAFDERLQRQVALKEVHALDPDRVLREAQAAARLNHPAIVTLYELGEREGHAVLVSELVPGDTLARLGTDGRLCDRDVAEIAADLCEGLVHAHGRGVVHRDIKPQNVIVRDGLEAGRRAKLLDFGIARIAHERTLTATGEVVGTLAYMSPEQAEGDAVGPESDVYSLGLTAYECWAGLNPIAARTPAETARRIGAGVPPLRLHRPDLPEGLADTIDACLDPEPELRPSPIELRECLEAEMDELDALVPLRYPSDDDEPALPRPRPAAGRVAALVGFALGLIALAGPLGRPGLALVLALLSVPTLVLGATAASLAPLAAAPLGAFGLGAPAAALGAAGSAFIGRAILGAGAWCWLLAASIGLGAGPDLGIAPQAASGWASDVSTAAADVLAPLATLDSLLGAAIFAGSAVVLGWVLEARHASLALLGAMLWAAGAVAALGVVGNGALGHAPLSLVAAGAVAVAIEFAARSRAGLPGERLREPASPLFASGR